MDTVTNGSNNIDTIRLESNFDAMHEIELNIKLGELLPVIRKNTFKIY